MLIIINKLIKLSYIFKLNFFYLFSLKKYFIKIFNIKFIKVNSIFFYFNSFFLFYKKLCTFKYPLLLIFPNNLFSSISNLFIKKFKNYLKFSLLHITRILNFQWDLVYKRNAVNYYNNFLILTKNVSISFGLYVMLKVSNTILFSFYHNKIENIFNFKNNNNFLNKNNLDYFNNLSYSNKLSIKPIFSVFYKNSYKLFSNNLYINKNYSNINKLKNSNNLKKNNYNFNYRRLYLNNFIKYKYKGSLFFIKNNKLKYKLLNISIRYSKRYKIVNKTFVKKKIKLKKIFLNLKKKSNLYDKLKKLKKNFILKKKKFLKNNVNFFRFNSKNIKVYDNFKPLIYNKKVLNFIFKIKSSRINNYSDMVILEFLFKNTFIIDYIKLNIDKFNLSENFNKFKLFVKKNSIIKYFKKEERCKMNIQNYFLRPSTYNIQNLLEINLPYFKNLLFEKKKKELHLKHIEAIEKKKKELEEEKKLNESLGKEDSSDFIYYSNIIDNLSPKSNPDNPELIVNNQEKVCLTHNIILGNRVHTITFDKDISYADFIRLQRRLDKWTVPALNIFFNVFEKIYNKEFDINSFNIFQFKFKFLKKKSKYVVFFKKKYRNSIIFELKNFFKSYLFSTKDLDNSLSNNYRLLKNYRECRLLHFLYGIPYFIRKFRRKPYRYNWKYKKNRFEESSYNFNDDSIIDYELTSNKLIKEYLDIFFNDDFYSEVSFFSFKKLDFNIFYIKKYSYYSFFTNRIFLNFIIILNTLKYFKDWKYKIKANTVFVNNKILKYLISISDLRDLKNKKLFNYSFIPNLKINNSILLNSLKSLPDYKIRNIKSRFLLFSYLKKNFKKKNFINFDYKFFFF